MKYRLFLLITVTTLSPLAFPQAQPQKPATQAEEPPPVLAVPKDYRYNARGRRDPFLNPIPKPVEKKGPAANIPPVQRPPGLKGVLISEAGISGIVTSRDPSMNVVSITAPGGKVYFARVGDALYDAVVKSIKPDSVTFALTAPGAPNEKGSREVVRKMRPTPGEDK